MKEFLVLRAHLLGFAIALLVVLAFFGAENFFALIDGLLF